MIGRTVGPKRRVDQDGVRSIEDPRSRHSVWLLVLAMSLVGLPILMVVGPVLQTWWKDPAQATGGEVEPGAAKLFRVARNNPTVRPRAPTGKLPAASASNVDTTNDESAGVPDDKTPSKAEIRHVEPSSNDAIPAEEASGNTDIPDEEHSGIYVFPPAGTNPPKPGIIVPEGYTLPPGYVRYYQTTDDGRQLPAILMFHPDSEVVDENGVPITNPEDRVVPPEKAPPDLPIQILKIPETKLPTDSPPADRSDQGP